MGGGWFLFAFLKEISQDSIQCNIDQVSSVFPSTWSFCLVLWCWQAWKPLPPVCNVYCCNSTGNWGFKLQPPGTGTLVVYWVQSQQLALMSEVLTLQGLQTGKKNVHSFSLHSTDGLYFKPNWYCLYKCWDVCFLFLAQKKIPTNANSFWLPKNFVTDTACFLSPVGFETWTHGIFKLAE